ncbi:MAG: hypothetical protein ACLFPB_06425 [Desulfovermiculus sp.]
MPFWSKEFSPSQFKEAWLFFFFLGLVMLNYPFLVIFNKVILFIGIPLPVLYLFIGWPLSILVIYFFSRGLGSEAEQVEDAASSEQGKTL